MKLPKVTTRAVLCVAFLASLTSALVTTSLLYKSLGGRKQEAIIPTIQEKLEEYSPKAPDKTQFNILLLGQGGAGHSGGELTDAIVLASINTASKNVNLIAIPRDIWVDNFKINSAYAAGVDVAKAAVEKVTGIPVDYYVAVDFSRFEKSIDALGGITVDVPVAFDDYFYPIKGLENELCGMTPEKIEKIHRLYSGFELEKQFTCRYEHLHFDKGAQQMDGATALKFIRSRHSSEHGGDFARGVRAQAVLAAIKNKLISLEALNNIDKFYAQFKGLVTSDIDEEDIVAILSRAGDPSEYTLSNVNISTDNYLQNAKSPDGQYILNPKAGVGNWEQVHAFIKSKLR